MKKAIFPVAIFLFVIFILAMTVRGVPGNPNNATLNTPQLKNEGPLELSPERGKFALTYSLIEDKSFQFSLPVAKFVTPDLGYKDGKYVSLFAPGVSFVVIPGYILGKLFGISQVGTFATISLFAVANSLLIYAIAKKLKANTLAATLASFLFVFATPAFAYAVSLYQHHISTFMILSSVYALLLSGSFWPLVAIWLMYGFSVSIDYPNAILMFPILIYALGKIFKITQNKIKLNIKINILGILTSIVLVIPIAFFLWTNNSSYGNPLQIAGTVRSVKKIDNNGYPLFSEDLKKSHELRIKKEIRKKTAVGFFATRKLMNGFYVHFVSPDRGIIFYTPVILMGIIGGFIAYKRRLFILPLLVSIVGVNILLYSMWGDPWGGWAFGSRYLIPSYAIMAILSAIMLTKMRKNLLFLFIFFIFFAYSVGVNTLGALTSNSNPPQIEIAALEKTSGIKQKYTYFRNFDLLKSGKSKSFVFNEFLSSFLTPEQYYLFLLSLIVIISAGMTGALYLKKKE